MSEWAKCLNCGKDIEGHPAKSYPYDEVFCCLDCNLEYEKEREYIPEEPSK